MLNRSTAGNSFIPVFIQALIRWFDAYGGEDTVKNPQQAGNQPQIDWLRAIPFIGMHLAPLSVLWVGWSPVAVITCFVLYALRMFAITGFYHRYFAHRAFKTTRLLQFIFALAGASAVQRGPLWWAAHHRLHHAHADKETDEHSPGRQGFFWSHLGWFLSRRNFMTRLDRIRDFARYPELRFIDRFDILVPVTLAISLLAFGAAWGSLFPESGTSAWQMMIWGFVISTLMLYHVTFTINSLAHAVGRRRFNTPDNSRNNWLLALLTFGEGWHNNHHHYPASVRQGFVWWEIDISYYLLRLLAALGLIWDLREIPHRVRQQYNPVDG